LGGRPRRRRPVNDNENPECYVYFFIRSQSGSDRRNREDIFMQRTAITDTVAPSAIQLFHFENTP